MCPQRHQIDIKDFFGVNFTEFRTLRFRIVKIAGNYFVVNGYFVHHTYENKRLGDNLRIYTIYAHCINCDIYNSLMYLRDTDTVKWWTDGKMEQIPYNSNGWDTFYYYKGNHTEKSYQLS